MKHLYKILLFELCLFGYFFGPSAGFFKLLNRQQLMPLRSVTSPPQFSSSFYSLVETVRLNNIMSVAFGSDTEGSMTIDDLSNALKIWENCLLQGIQPETVCWPPQPLLARVYTAFGDLKIPRLIAKHNELLPSVMRALVKLCNDYASEVKNRATSEAEEEEEKEIQETWDNSPSSQPVSLGSGLSDEVKDLLSELAVRKFTAAWGPPIGALATMDAIYGSSHGLMNFGDLQEQIQGGGGGGAGGFGLFDG